MAAARILHEDANLKLAGERNLLVAAWSDAPRAAHIRIFARGIREIVAKYSADMVVMDVVLGGTPHFADDMRAELVQMVRDPGLQGLGAAHVIEVGGLVGVATRAFLSTVILLARGNTPNKVFPEPRSAAVWLAAQLAKGRERWSVEQVLAVRSAAVIRASATSA